MVAVWQGNSKCWGYRHEQGKVPASIEKLSHGGDKGRHKELSPDHSFTWQTCDCLLWQARHSCAGDSRNKVELATERRPKNQNKGVHKIVHVVGETLRVIVLKVTVGNWVLLLDQGWLLSGMDIWDETQMLSQAWKHLDKSIPDKPENKTCSRSRKKAKVSEACEQRASWGAQI